MSARASGSFLNHCKDARRGVEVENALRAGASEQLRRSKDAIVAEYAQCVGPLEPTAIEYSNQARMVDRVDVPWLIVFQCASKQLGSELDCSAKSPGVPWMPDSRQCERERQRHFTFMRTVIER